VLLVFDDLLGGIAFAFGYDQFEHRRMMAQQNAPCLGTIRMTILQAECRSMAHLLAPLPKRWGSIFIRLMILRSIVVAPTATAPQGSYWFQN